MNTETRDSLLEYARQAEDGPISSAPSARDIVDAEVEILEPKRKSASELAKLAYERKKAKAAAQAKAQPQPKATVDDLVPSDPTATPSVKHALEVLKDKVKDKETRVAPAKESASLATTRSGVVKLMNALNINLDLQLTRNDTATLLSCLLTANEGQLKALQNNNKIPIAIKTVIKRLLDDAKVGNMETVERMWDRLFGKAPMTESARVSSALPGVPVTSAPTESILPDGVVSRETYMVIKETLMK